MKCLNVCLILALACLWNGSARGGESAPKAQLAAALAQEDLAAIKAAVAAGRQAAGEKAGVPEVADKYLPVPQEARPLSRIEAQPGFTPYFRKLQQLCTWHIGQDPAKLKMPLRAPAAILAGNLAVCRAKLAGSDQSLAMAREAAEFLMWAQAQGGTGVYPFPAVPGERSSRAMEVADDSLRALEAAGKLKDVLRNGWIIDDLQDGGLQFDNGECGVAMFEFYEFTHDAKALASAQQAADWASRRPLVSNWNYNSFSVWLLAKAFAVTGEKRYYDAAVKKATLGVMPGQLLDGPRAGRWLDPHNARPAYHYIMLRALAQLLSVMPPDEAHRPEILRALTLGLKARNAEIISQGAMNKDKAIETLLLVRKLFPNDPELLQDSLTTEALGAVVKLVSDQFRKGALPLGPREMGLLLEYSHQ